MKNLFIGICEESEAETELLIQYLRIAEASLGMSFEIHTYTTGKDLLNVCCPVFDILFLDLPLPDIHNELLLSQIRKQDAIVQIILLSNSDDLYHLGYKYNARNYFTKPIWYRNIYHELKKLFSEDGLLKRPYLWISNHQGNKRLYLHKLRYIETSNRQLCFHYGNEEIYMGGKVSAYEVRLDSGKFFRFNNSYLVNVYYIEEIKKELNRYCISLITGEKIPLSRDKKKELEMLMHILP